MTYLSYRAEQAAPDETRGLLAELADKSGRGPMPWAFHQLLLINTPEAHLAAAMMLVPEEWAATVTLFTTGKGRALLWQRSLLDAHSKLMTGPEAANPALALIAAIAKAGGHDAE